VTIRYPWPTFVSSLQCHLTDICLDGKPIKLELVDGEYLRLRLDSVGDWDRFDCDVAVMTDEPVPAGIDDLFTYVLVASPSTNTRMPFPLKGLRGKPATGHLTVPRSVVEGSFTVQAEIGANVAGRRRVVGSSDAWTVVLERREAPTPPGTPPFDIAWINFSDTGAPSAARESPNAHALMDLTQEPRLLLNSGIEGLQTLLHNNTAKLERRRVRDILSSSVTRYAVGTLFRAAAAEVSVYDDGPPQPPSSALLRQVCEAVAGQMSGVGAVDELYEQLAASGDTPLDNTELWMRIDLAIDGLMGSTDALSTAAREVANG
jgi:hypothetical protein